MDITNYVKFNSFIDDYAKEMIINMINKDTPMKPIICNTWSCPKCGKTYLIGNEEHEYCPNCGQSIDWNEEEE